MHLSTLKPEPEPDKTLLPALNTGDHRSDKNGSYSGANVKLSHTLPTPPLLDAPPLPSSMTLQAGLVNTWNEWDQLEEIIVETASMAVIPPIEPALILKSQLHSGFI